MTTVLLNYGYNEMTRALLATAPGPADTLGGVDMAKATCSVEGCEKPAKARGWCGGHYRNWRLRGIPVIVQPTADERFWAKVARSDPADCWPWTGFVDKAGYARFRDGGESRYGHRWVFERTNGPIPKELNLDHTCHNADLTCAGGSECRHRRCVNPSHLEAVDPNENSRRSPNWVGHRQFCIHGHPYTPENTGHTHGKRRCAECHRQRERGRRKGLL